MIRLNTGLRRWRRGLSLAAVVAGLGVAVAIHHVEMPEGGEGMADAVCLAVLGAGMALAVPALASAGARWPLGDDGAAVDSTIVPGPLPAARDGPAVLRVFLS
ncbi:MAG: hypothetical protein H0U42_00760 [Thermoleophilaceae bacterium]|nr:hypothetical protein [Thermoleophilaceae bacterium]